MGGGRAFLVKMTSDWEQSYSYFWRLTVSRISFFRIALLVLWVYVIVEV